MSDDIISKMIIDFGSQQPIYRQLISQIQQLITTGQIGRGEHLPSIRHLGNKLNVSPNTVARAYLELERDQVVVTRRGKGTTVSSHGDLERLREGRQAKLHQDVKNEIIRLLSQGYEPEQLEAAFYTNLERWREENDAKSTSPVEIPPEFISEGLLRISGSYDVALNILVNLLRHKARDITIELNNVSSINGLISLSERKSEVVGIHLLDEETQEYNLPFVKRFFPGQKVAIINLAIRKQGLMFRARNPKHVKDITSLADSTIKFINQPEGSGTRIFLDMQLKDHGIPAEAIHGYEHEVSNNLLAALAISQGEADIGIGIQAIAHSCGLDFLPLSNEQYDLVVPMHVYKEPLVVPLLTVIKSDEFKSIVQKVEGYDTQNTGNIIFTE